MAINISKQALDRARDLFIDDFPDVSSTAFEKKDTLQSLDKIHRNNPNKDAVLVATSSNKVHPPNGSLQPQSDFYKEGSTPYFTAASGKIVNVSKEALNKAKNLFDDIPADKEVGSVKPHPSSCEQKPVGFSTASGKHVAVSKEAFDKVKNIFNDIPENYEFGHDNNKSSATLESVGFLTANGKKVDVSEEALNKAKGLFDDIPSELCSASSSFNKTLMTPKKTIGSRPKHQTPNRASSSSKGKSCLDDFSNDLALPGLFKEFQEEEYNSSSKGGFSTASGKSVTISKEALDKVKTLFDELASDSESNAAMSPKNPKCPNDLGPFNTSGKTVHVSEEALQKVKGLFDSEDLASGPSLDLEKDSVNLKGSSIQMVGFQTAGGKGVQISRDSLKKAQKLFDESSTESQSGESKSANSTIASIPMQGFSTAGGKAVLISETALQKAKNLFEDLPSDSATSDVGQSHNFSISEKELKTKFISKDDSGVFTSNTLNESSTYEIQKSSLIQEITASTAAFLADCESADQVESGSTVSKVMETISTSPSMASDRLSCLRPVLSSSSENKAEAAEPTSPILVNNKSFGQRRRSRRGRLSLSSNTSIKSPTFGSQANSNVSSQSNLRKPRLSLPARSNLSSPPTKRPTIDKESGTGQQISVQLGDSSSSSNVSVNHPPSRKLFTDEPTLSSSMHSGSASKVREITSPMKESKPVSIKSDNAPAMRHSHQTPLMRKVLTRNSGPQTSGFKTPYKSPSKEQLKRQPSSPAQNPPEAKRRKPSTNLYVSHVYGNSFGSVKINGRELRPEVAEMRRRAAEEQKQLVANHVEEKGDLLRPCVGSWLAGKLKGEESHKKAIKLSEIGQPLMHPSRKLINIGLNASTVTVTAANAAEFRFSAWDHYSEDVCRENVAGLPVGDGALLVLDSRGTAGVEEIERSFFASPGVDPSLVPSGWVKNHYRWLVWKLASVESRFPHHFKKRCLSPHILMLQLKYRYDREVDRCERPALRRILEHDDSAAKRMVLCVAGIINSNQPGIGLELELTDGWYSVTASIDLDMQHRVRKGVIAVGTKLIMHGAELVNCSEGCSPLQVHPEVRIKLCSNSTRRARWHAKLGFQDNPGPMRISLGSILSSGGVVSCVSVYIARVYPLVFMEKTQDRTIIRSQRAESKEVSKSEKKIHQLAETVYSQVQAEIQKEQMIKKKSCIKFSLKNLPNVTSGEELFEILESTSDPLSVQNMLSKEQKNNLEDYQRAKQEELSREMESRVRLQLSEKSKHERQVTPVLKVRLLNFDKQNCSAILSVWRPTDDLTSAFKEGQKMTIFGVTANGLRCGDLQLSASRSTRYQADTSSDIKSDLLRTVSPLSALASPGIVPRFGELDIVGFVIKVGPAPQTSENTSHFQTAYVCDGHHNIVGLSFWDGLKEFGVEDLVTPSSFIAASNLQCRAGAIARSIPCVYASELSLFTTNPRQGHLQAAMRELRQSLPTDLKSFRRECEEKLDSLQLLRGSSSAVCPRTPDPTPLSNPAQPTSASVNAQERTPTNAPGADPVKTQRKLSMDHQFKTPSSLDNLSPAARLAKLEVYGEPPPISPILLSNPRRSLRTQFKAPRKTDSPSGDCMKLQKP
ncbi:hypothetical protein ONE63_009973 [Megalurothrips usitatus]|uniref:Tower domain-containing protein n=1 Tax=Megalurothrips usitatus TaxID=439358 RepID=A0AAV7XNW9_9NEOP|nr:hypothetical protein ONE63_009973 [Megalurothrips usitatus]